MMSTNKFTSMRAGSLYRLYLWFVEYGSTQVDVFQRTKAYSSMYSIDK